MARRTAKKSGKSVRVGLLGLGTVGRGVVEILTRHRALIAERSGVELTVVRALVRSSRQRRGAAGRVPLTRRAADIVAAADVDVVCELLGGLDPSRRLIEQALRAHKPVVTANKAVLARFGPQLFELARRQGADLYFEGAVAGGLPIIRTLREGLAGDRIKSVMGILNGTTNFILGRIEGGHSYEAALAEAQALGFAEADPRLDVGGGDAADKLAILMHLAFGLHVPSRRISTAGVVGLSPEILRDAAALGCRVKLVALARRHEGTGGGIEAHVQPTLVPLSHPLATVGGADNAVAVESEALGLTLYQGAGAGGLPTGTAVVADLIDVARNLAAGLVGRPGPRLDRAARLLDGGRSAGAYYLRLLVSDRPGVLASITRIFAAQGVSVATIRQERGGARGGVPVAITTHPASTAAVARVMARIGKIAALRAAPNLLRMLT
jgi:homoserine dehydrogenase